ncbi:tyrosine-type recombinase/integrase [Halococcus agarilyticus]|uniref:tyrosine-type recombinase/integrase n=1 Tax=Halococcus agarilyticus TaxID=1232219 RepID=UPI00067800A5|nr:site-specific integrase [Halococcus agarilyticus]
MQSESQTAKTGRSEKTQVDKGDKPTYWLKPEQIDEMRMATVEQSAHYLADRNDALIAVMADTGLRVNETRLLDTDMIDFQDGVLSIPASIQKGYVAPEDRNEDEPYSGPKPATIGLASDTLRTLRKYINGSWYQRKDTVALFPGRSSDRISTQGIRNMVGKAAEQAEVRPRAPEGRGEPSDVGPHQLRHSVFYRMVRRDGKPLIEVTKRLRHASRSTTEAYYGHLDVV